MSEDFRNDRDHGAERRDGASGDPDPTRPPGADEDERGIDEAEAVNPGDDESAGEQPVDDNDPPPSLPRLSARRKGRRLIKKAQLVRGPLTPEQRLLILDTWRRSGLPAADFSVLVGVSKHTLYAWRRRFETRGPAGLVDRPKGGPRGSRLSELTKRSIIMLKEANPDWGCQRISDMLLRGPALPASPSAVARVLHEAGYECEEVSTRAHKQEPKRFERSRANQLWQSDLFTFTLKRQNRRVYLVAFLDDHSRFIVGFGLHSTQASALVLEVLRAAIVNYRTPDEVLTDNGSQYVTWRGKSAFSKELQQRGIRHVVATPRRPQTLGKIERFWGSLWRECVEHAVFVDLEDARKRLALYIDHYNFQRPHQGIDGLVPADRYFGAAPEVLKTLRARVEKNALDLAREGLPKEPFYLTGNAGGKPFSVHAEGERLFLTRDDGERKEIELADRDAAESKADSLPDALCPDGSPHELARDDELAPGESPLDSVVFDGDRAEGESEEKGGES